MLHRFLEHPQIPLDDAQLEADGGIAGDSRQRLLKELARLRPVLPARVIFAQSLGRGSIFGIRGKGRCPLPDGVVGLSGSQIGVAQRAARGQIIAIARQNALETPNGGTASSTARSSKGSNGRSRSPRPLPSASAWVDSR